ncbi:FAD-binding domain-containing protein [Buchnera aphidicola]|uniref:FAD-binding domain-containing protein n=1 Tax=Buchnera aphidicola TaxID=9 RepID=UPI0020939F59|nr:FAD-binding domain-containing protein [Buchnera aphidicola]USS94325.1 deoxyribodipyrimidine photo-lyase [Buchnera aphidicola (Sipha maydis)]
MNNLVWFRNDLRIEDNKALYFSCKNKKKNVIALFIATPEQWKIHDMSYRQAFFIHKRLIYLKKKLKKINISFFYKEVKTYIDCIEYLLNFCKKYNINNVFYNYQYELNETHRDKKIKKILLLNKIFFKGFHDNVLINPKLIKNNDGLSYKIFRFFKKKSLKILKNHKIKLFKTPKIRKKNIMINNHILFFSYKYEKFHEKTFPYKDNQIKKKIKIFFDKKIYTYLKSKDYPIFNSTSKFSLYLSLGIFSIRKFFYYIIKKKIKNKKNLFILLEKILWRDFFKHLFFQYPILSQNKSFKFWEKKIKWNNSEKYLKSWEQGKTGYPIVDAGMRELNLTGWINNRIRMITSNFLVKNLFIDWKLGAKYFMLKLIDADFSLNTGNWQWISSIGTDSVPYIRTFNPYIQSKKFDLNGDYIKKYIPELIKVPIKHIHNPQFWLKKNDPHSKYPQPIVEYKLVKKIFIKKIKKIIQNKKYE